ncbi:MAG: HIT domain-containing protein [Alphaproteobacteria bacterium]|nr:HIT domain-containing protein [Alphaproteobacteria bacterium]
MDCIFCKICAHEAFARIVYQDDVVSCFLPKEIEVYGHLLIVPNQHYETIFEIPEKELTHIMTVAKRISLSLKKSINATGVNILHASGKSAQQSVPHFHIHIFPRFDNDGLDTWPKIEKQQYDADEILKKIKVLSK